MNVLSLFDGISCGQLALQKAGIKVSNYYASEIEKPAISVTMKHFPNTVQLGSVEDLVIKKQGGIDLLIGGSPCQSLSQTGNGSGFNGKSKLFWEYARIKKALNPKWFLLENVPMKPEWLSIITNEMGVEPILINSSLLSAQNRKRYYWTNIPIGEVADKGLLLSDILTDESTPYGTYTATVKKKESICILDGLADNIKGHDYNRRIYNRNGKCPTLAAASGGNLEPKVSLCNMVGVADDASGFEANGRVYGTNGKNPTVLSGFYKGIETKISIDEKYYRKVTPLECERLQTLPDNYTDILSRRMRYKCIGNGWTVDVIAHIFKGLI